METGARNLLETEYIPLAQLTRWAEQGFLFAVIDACDEPDVPARAEAEGKERAVSLYRGAPEEDFADFAPYLFRVDLDLFDWIRGDYWDKPWGILALATASLEEVRTHFRHFLQVEDPDGKAMYFRFYDPRVLRTFLPTCTARELAAFFGTLEGLAVSEEEDGEALLYRPGAAVTRDREPPAPDPAPSPPASPASSAPDTPLAAPPVAPPNHRWSR